MKKDDQNSNVLWFPLVHLVKTNQKCLKKFTRPFSSLKLDKKTNLVVFKPNFKALERKNLMFVLMYCRYPIRTGLQRRHEIGFNTKVKFGLLVFY